MSQVQSSKAKAYVWEKIPWVYLDCAVKAIIIAETEAEERHAKELEAVELKTIEVYKRNCRNYTVYCFDKSPCTADCEYLTDFIQKLNER